MLMKYGRAVPASDAPAPVVFYAHNHPYSTAYQRIFSDSYASRTVCVGYHANKANKRTKVLPGCV